MNFLSKRKAEGSGSGSIVQLYGLIIFLFGIALVAVDFDEKVDAGISSSNHMVEKELDVFWDKLLSVVRSRNFITNLSFNVNLAATSELDELVDQLDFHPNVFVYDVDKRYFGKNRSNDLNRFDFKIVDNVISREQTRAWRYIEVNGTRYIQRFKILQVDGKIAGYVRVVFSLDELQENILEKLELPANLSVKNNSYAFVRCEISPHTDLLMCMPMNFKSLVNQSGTLMAFVGLFWAFLVFIASFYLRGRLAQARAQTLVEVSSQVSHDIQSPLLALKVATKDLTELPEEQRMMVHRSISRIEDIVNDLRNKRDSNLESKNREDLHLLYGLVNSILSEKRLQFKYREIELDLFVAPGLQTAFVKLSQKDFKRVLSNIINNAVEAIPAHGNVGIEIEEEGNNLLLKIVDNGAGMPSNILKQAFKKGISSGKEKGQGLGLYHAKKMADLWGAELDIVSVEDKGTSVEIRIPRADAPVWFPRQLSLEEETNLVILDDDQNIHEMWVKRFESIGLKNKVIHFYHVESAESRLPELSSEKLFFLVDYELIHSEKTGIDFILSNELIDQAVLVTARYDDERVLSQCTSHRISLLPKVLMNEYELFTGIEVSEVKANIIPIKPTQAVQSIQPVKIEQTPGARVSVLIDDDPLVRKVWEMSAMSKDIDLKTYSSAEDFMNGLFNIPQDAKIYVDVDLGGVRGDEWSKSLADLGYANLYLTTGFDDIDLSAKPWLKDCFSKEPPF